MIFVFAVGAAQSRNGHSRWNAQAVDGESTTLLHECAHADTRQWASLHRNQREIDHVFSGAVQRSESGTYTSAAAALAEHANAARHHLPRRALLTAEELADLRFEVSPHTRRVHVYSASAAEGSFSPAELHVDIEVLHDSAHATGGTRTTGSERTTGGEHGTGDEHDLDAAICGAADRAVQLRFAAARFLRAWERVRPVVRPVGLTCTLSGLALQCDALRQVQRESRVGASTQRVAPRLTPSNLEQSRLPADAVWIPADVREVRTASLTVTVHWQPFLTDPRPPAGEASDAPAIAGSLLCVNSSCFRPLDMASRSVQLGGTLHPLPAEPAPSRCRTSMHAEHADAMGLVCGGACWKAHQLSRNPTATRREVRKYHERLVGTVYCQHCGVDCLVLALQLRGLDSEDSRRRLLLSNLPHLAAWRGKLERAVRDPSEGHLWEVDHRVEVRDGGGEASSVAAYDPLCVACHQEKTNATTRGVVARAAAFAERGACEAAQEGAPARAKRKRKQPSDEERTTFAPAASAQSVAPSPPADPTAAASSSASGSPQPELGQPQVTDALRQSSPTAACIDLSLDRDDDDRVEGVTVWAAGTVDQPALDTDDGDLDALLANAPDSFFDAQSYRTPTDEALPASASGLATSASTRMLPNDDRAASPTPPSFALPLSTPDALLVQRLPVQPPPVYFPQPQQWVPLAPSTAQRPTPSMPSPPPPSAYGSAALATLLPNPAVPRGVWEVELSQAFVAYEEVHQRVLEKAYRRGDASARLTVRGQEYEISLTADKRQRLCANPRRSRRVRRREQI